MIITKILNNNFAIVKDEDHESIVMGRGICFAKQIGNNIEDFEIEKTYFLSSQDLDFKFRELINQIPLEQVQLITNIVDDAKRELGKKISDSIYISLLDHINFAIKRSEEGIFLRNALLWEIIKLYPNEYLVGTKALEKINSKFNLNLPEDEAGFIALHFVNAEFSDSSDSIYQETQLIQDIINIIRYHFKLELDNTSQSYFRLLTHLRYFAHRIMTNSSTLKSKDDAELFDIIIRKYADSYNCVQKIAKLILIQNKYTIMKAEETYLTIHIQRAVFNEI